MVRMTSAGQHQRAFSWGRRRHVVDLFYELIAREVKLRYRRSLLGVLWSLLAPLSQMAIFSFVFTRVVPLGIKNYSVFVFVGILGWTWFSSALLAATDSVVANSDLVRQPGFPVPLLPVLPIGSTAVNYVLALPVLLGAILATTHHLPVTVVALPLILAVQFVFTSSLAYFLAAFHVSFRDVAHLVGILLLPLFYVTPIFYGDAQIPHRFRLVFALNPIGQLLKAQRALLLDGVAPDWRAVAGVAAIALILLSIGYRVFVHRSARFAEEL